MLNHFHKITQSFNQWLAKQYNNFYLLIGIYGILIIAFVATSTSWFFHAHLKNIYQHSLPPAWYANGDINHILGTTKHGQDIFDYLLIGYRASMTMTIETLLCVIVMGSIINYLLFFVPIIRGFLLLFFRLFNIIPPLLGVIIIGLLFKDSIANVLLVVGLTYMPRFINNLHQKILKESQKTYILAYRLDGLSTFSIFNHFIIPNIFPIYFNEIVVLFGQILLAITTLTFLGFANNHHTPDLGMMMFVMKDLLSTNYWAFLAPGLAIAITIILVNLLNIGLFGRGIGNQ